MDEKKYTLKELEKMLNGNTKVKSNKVKVNDYKLFGSILVLRKIEYIEIKDKVMK